MSSDPRPSLNDFAKRATQYSINLNGRVVRDESRLIRGGFAFVYKGTLLPEKKEVAIKTARGGLPGEERLIKVRSLFILYSFSEASAAHPKRGASMVQAPPRKCPPTDRHYHRVRPDHIDCIPMDAERKRERIRTGEKQGPSPFGELRVTLCNSSLLFSLLGHGHRGGVTLPA